MLHKPSSPRRNLAVLVWIAVVGFAGFSCMSIKEMDTADSKNVVSLLQKGDSAGLVKLSATPFLLDKEIVAIPGDVQVFWAGLVKAGFSFSDFSVDQAAAVDKDTAVSFGSSMEIKAFFKNYVPSTARVLTFTTSAGKRAVLIVAHEKGQFHIIGFRGPF